MNKALISELFLYPGKDCYTVGPSDKKSYKFLIVSSDLGEANQISLNIEPYIITRPTRRTDQELRIQFLQEKNYNLIILDTTSYPSKFINDAVERIEDLRTYCQQTHILCLVETVAASEANNIFYAKKSWDYEKMARNILKIFEKKILKQ